MARNDETDLRRYDWSKAERGKYAERARRSLTVLALEKRVVKALGGPDAVARILTTLADSIEPPKKKKSSAA
jgi:hypothetical protein